MGKTQPDRIAIKRQLTCRWHGDALLAMVTMVTAMPDHRRCGTAL